MISSHRGRTSPVRVRSAPPGYQTAHGPLVVNWHTALARRERASLKHDQRRSGRCSDDLSARWPRPPQGRRAHPAKQRHNRWSDVWEVCMKRHSTIDSTHNLNAQMQSEQLPAATLGELPNRLLTAFEVAEFVGCHEETVRRAYLRGLLNSTRFGVRGRRFHPRDVLDWIRRGAPTRVS